MKFEIKYNLSALSLSTEFIKVDLETLSSAELILFHEYFTGSFVRFAGTMTPRKSCWSFTLASGGIIGIGINSLANL